jgi:hypothetical protein
LSCFNVGDLPDEKVLNKIIFTDLYPNIDLEHIWDKYGLMKVTWTKDSEWQYEKEWRRTNLNDNKIEPHNSKFKLNNLWWMLNFR